MTTIKELLKADGLLLLVAIIWGFAFVAQRSGMEVIGPFAFSAVRFALGAVSLVPVLLVQRWRRAPDGVASLSLWKRFLLSALMGALLFIAASLQQLGLVTTTAGNAGFITCLYVVLVPVVGIFLGRKTGIQTWIGAVLALAGLYIISIGAGLKLVTGDLYELVGAFFWTAYILVIGPIGKRMDAVEFSMGQFATCSVLSLVTAVVVEPNAFAGVRAALIPILYGGIMSSGVAFTLQVVAQRTAHPSHASIIFSMQALIAALGGVLFLHEPVTTRLLVGGSLMFAGMLCSQLTTTKGG